MVFVLPEVPSFGSEVGRNVGSGFSQGFASAMQRRQDEKKQLQAQKMQEMQMRREDEAAKGMGIDLAGIRDPKLRHEIVSRAMEGQNQSRKFSQEFEADAENFNQIKNAFGEKFAKIWMASPQGARTELTRSALEARARGIDLEQLLSGVSDQSNDQESALTNASQEVSQRSRNPISPTESEDTQVENEMSRFLKTQDKNILPEEKVKRGEKRYETGLKIYHDASDKLRGMTRDRERIDILENLEKTGKLPKNLGRLNVDKEGNLRLPFLGTPEAQRFVKTLNEFSTGAKDTFGSRVTNFDLAQYLKRYPTLLNTDEGRRQLYDQMKVVNQINSVFYKNLKNVYDKAGGVRNIDADAAERYAERLSDDKISKLSEKFKQIGQFASKPSASEFKGKKIRDKDTGEVFVSDGENWIPQE